MRTWLTLAAVFVVAACGGKLAYDPDDGPVSKSPRPSDDDDRPSKKKSSSGIYDDDDYPPLPSSTSGYPHPGSSSGDPYPGSSSGYPYPTYDAGSYPYPSSSSSSSGISSSSGGTVPYCNGSATTYGCGGDDYNWKCSIGNWVTLNCVASTPDRGPTYATCFCSGTDAGGAVTVPFQGQPSISVLYNAWQYYCGGYCY